MLPTGYRTGSIKMMSIRTGRLVTRDQLKILPMPSTVIAKLNEMAEAEGRKILPRTKIVRVEERGLHDPDRLTYIRPTVKPSVANTVDSENVIEGVIRIEGRSIERRR